MRRHVYIIGVIIAMFGGAAASAQSTTLRSIGVDTSRAKIPLAEISSGGPPP